MGAGHHTLGWLEDAWTTLQMGANDILWYFFIASSFSSLPSSFFFSESDPFLMSFGTTPTSTTPLGTNQFPVSAVFVPGTAGGALTTLQGGPSSTDGNGFTSAPAAMYMPDGSNITLGTTTDATYSGSGPGSAIALLKKLVAELAGTLNVNVANGTSLGQSTMAGSSPVALASDQTPVAIKRNTISVYAPGSTTTSGSTGNSGDLSVGPYTEISLDINMTTSGGTSPTIQFFWDRKGADGVYYPIYQSAIFSSFSSTTYLSTSIGAGMVYNVSLGLTGRLRWVVGGSSTPTVTMTISIYGK